MTETEYNRIGEHYLEWTKEVLEYLDGEYMEKLELEDEEKFEEKMDELEAKTGFAYPLKKDAPDDIKKKHALLSAFNRESAKRGEIIG